MSSSADILQVAVVLRVVCLLFLLCFETVVRLLLRKAVPPFSIWFYCLYQNSETSSPGLLSCPPFSGDYPVLLTFYSGNRKHLPNLLILAGGLNSEGLIYGGKFAFQIFKFTGFTLFYFVFGGNFPSTSPRGGGEAT